MKNYIAVIDSGVGGVNLLRECTKVMPHEHFIYYADTKNAPYGNKSKQKITKCIISVIDELMLHFNIKLILLACNTATATCINEIRQKYKICVVGIEPAIKKAIDTLGSQKILVLATVATIKHSAVVKRYSKIKNVIILKQRTLARLIDDNLADLSVLDGYIKKRFNKFENAGAVVLGCTHYIFIKDLFKKYLPRSQFFEASFYVAQRVKKLLTDSSSLKSNGKGSVLFLISGEDEKYKNLLKQQFIL